MMTSMWLPQIQTGCLSVSCYVNAYDCLTDWLTACKLVRLTDWLTDSLTAWWSSWLIFCLTDRLTDGWTDWLTDWMSNCLSFWLTDFSALQKLTLNNFVFSILLFHVSLVIICLPISKHPKSWLANPGAKIFRFGVTHFWIFTSDFQKASKIILNKKCWVEKQAQTKLPKRPLYVSIETV